MNGPIHIFILHDGNIKSIDSYFNILVWDVKLIVVSLYGDVFMNQKVWNEWYIGKYNMRYTIN